MRFRLRTLMIPMTVGPALIAGAWFLANSWVEFVGWTALPALFALAYVWLRKAQATSRGYGYYDVDNRGGA